MFGDYGNGAGGDPSADLNRATDIATMMEMKWGLGSILTVESGDTPGELSALRSRRKGPRKAVEATLQAEFERAKTLLDENRNALLDLHGRLLRETELSADTVRTAIEAAGRRAPDETHMESRTRF